MSMVWWARAIAGGAVAAVATVSPPNPEPALVITLRELPNTHAIVEVGFRNASDGAVDVPMVATLWLTPVVGPGESRPSESSTLSTPFDPAAGTADGVNAVEHPWHLRLPVGGVRAIRVDLAKLKWSLSPRIGVWTPRDLWEVAEYGEYDLKVTVVVDRGRPESLQSKPLRLRMGSR